MLYGWGLLGIWCMHLQGKGQGPTWQVQPLHTVDPVAHRLQAHAWHNLISPTVRRLLVQVAATPHGPRARQRQRAATTTAAGSMQGQRLTQFRQGG
jgi:hypothetical protein